MSAKARKNGNKAGAAGAAERRVKSFELRKQGFTYREIGNHLGISQTRAYQDVSDELRRLAEETRQSAEELRQMESDRLDIAMKAIAPQVRSGNIKAVLAWIKISERRSKLFGLDAAPRLNYLDIFKQLAEDGIITQVQFEAMKQAIAQFQASAIDLWKSSSVLEK